MADTTLPPVVSEPGIALRCTPQTLELGLDPLGTAASSRVLILIESAGLWPPKIEDADGFRDLPDLGPGHRVLATRGADSDAMPHLTVWRAGPEGRFAGVDYSLDPSRLPEVLADVVAATGVDGGVALPDGVEVVGPAPAELLICGHGRRDVCCGSYGVRLLAEVEARVADRPGEVRVRRCSHTGGHRFSPTGISLPDGRAWAFLDADLVDAVVTGAPDPRLPDHNRGLLAFDPWAQVAEGALWKAVGPTWSGPDSITPGDPAGPSGDGTTRTFRITWHDDGAAREATVAVRRTGQVPVPVCGAPITEATKSSPVLEVVGIDGL